MSRRDKTRYDPASAAEAGAPDPTGGLAYVDHLATGPIHVIWLPSVPPTQETALGS